MISVEEALGRVTAAFAPLEAETVPLAEALGRVLAENVAAKVSQPPVAVSAMDGYAVHAADVASLPAILRCVGEAPAGGSFARELGPGEAVRIFTGGPVPAGADTIVIQENTKVEGTTVTVVAAAPPGRYIRPAGLDFRRGEIGLRKGRRLTARDIGLAAAMNLAALPVRRKPKIAVLATGDELVPLGTTPGPHQIVSSNGIALAAFIAAQGGLAVDLGIARDSIGQLREAAAKAMEADLLVTTGGVSVGDHDLVQEAFGQIGFAADFWQVAMRPGKPLLFGRLGRLPVLGFPGNPVSALVCAMIYLGPSIATMLGAAETSIPTQTALLGIDLAANDHRQDYMRARLSFDAEGNQVVTPFPRQDSSMLSCLAEAGCLVIRPPHAPAAKAGSRVHILTLPAAAPI
jgi:molybdopterin molybdotransferase